jgi:hypothetical protein
MPRNQLLTIEDHQVIGELVVAFGYLEHELIRATIGACGGPEHLSEKDKEKIENVLDAGTPLSGRLSFFCGAARRHAICSKEIIDRFEREMTQAVKLRNMVCHGYWQRVSDKQLSVTFYSKGCIADGSTPIINKFTHHDLKERTELTLKHAMALSAY